jgi:hypothetical protein
MWHAAIVPSLCDPGVFSLSETTFDKSAHQMVVRRAEQSGGTNPGWTIEVGPVSALGMPAQVCVICVCCLQLRIPAALLSGDYRC